MKSLEKSEKEIYSISQRVGHSTSPLWNHQMNSSLTITIKDLKFVSYKETRKEVGLPAYLVDFISSEGIDPLLYTILNYFKWYLQKAEEENHIKDGSATAASYANIQVRKIFL